MKLIGYIGTTPVYEDPAAPPGKLYFLNDHYMQFSRFEPLSRWQRFLVTLKRMLKNGRL